MKRPLIYVDTSVFGGCFETEFATWSNGLMLDFKSGLFRGATSDIVAAEVAQAPDLVKAKYQEYINSETEWMQLVENVEQLAKAYLERKIVTKKFENDLYHIAIATANNADILVSWNFKHIVHYDKIVKFNAVNLELGFHQIMIHSPREVTTHE